MYNSLKSLLKYPVGIKNGTGTRNAAGELNYPEPVSHKVYRVDEFKDMTDATGKTVVSKITLYFDILTINMTDIMVLDGKDYKILGMTKYFDDVLCEVYV